MLEAVYAKTVVWITPLTQTLQHPTYKSPPWRNSHEVLDYRLDSAVLFCAISNTRICRDSADRDGNGLKGLDPQLAGVPASLITESLNTCV